MQNTGSVAAELGTSVPARLAEFICCRNDFNDKPPLAGCGVLHLMVVSRCWGTGLLECTIDDLSIIPILTDLR